MVSVKVKYLPDKKMGNYWGMNHEAGKELGFHPNPPSGTIYISDKLPKNRLKKVIIHEEVEIHMMKGQHCKYAKAHKVANQLEWHSFESKKKFR